MIHTNSETGNLDVKYRAMTPRFRVLAGPDIEAQFAVQGIDTMSATPEQYAACVRLKSAKWARVVQAAGARVD